MAKVFYSADANPGLVLGKKVAIVGYGSQGHAHSLNLRDSGADVRVGLRPGSKSWAKAESTGLAVSAISEAADWADTIMLLAPDTEQPVIYSASIAPYLSAGKTLMFAHGFNIRYGTITPPAPSRRTTSAARAARAATASMRSNSIAGPCFLAATPGATGSR